MGKILDKIDRGVVVVCTPTEKGTLPYFLIY